MSHTTFDLTIILVSYNSQFWLKKTLTTLKEFYLSKTSSKVKVVVVDNHSQDGTQELLKKSFKWVELIELSSNFGFAKANNIALRAFQASSKYCMLLNSDIEFTEKSNLDALIHYMDENSKVGMVTPRLEFANGSIDPASHRGEPDLWASFCYFSGLENLFEGSRVFGEYHQTYKNISEIHEIDACSGAAMLVSQAALKKVGLLDEQFFMYAEDLDWCKRFRDHRYAIVYYPFVTLIHHKNKSGIGSNSKQIAKKTTSYFYDTMLQYYDKHYRNEYPEWVRTLVKGVLYIKKGAL